MAGFNDWLTVSDPKLFAESLAAQFRLTETELQKAQEALQPAFALGLQRAMTDPAAWSDLARTFSAMAPGGAASGLPQAQPGEAFMQAIFGSEALTGAVARHASMFAGIAPATMQQMMPGLALLTMEALVRSTLAGIARSQPPGLATGDYGSATAEMLRRGANAVEALTRPSDQRPRPCVQGLDIWSPASFADAFAEALRTGMPWLPQSQGAAPVPPRRPQGSSEAPPEAINPMLPFATLFDAFARGMQATVGAAAASPPVAAEPEAPTPPARKPTAAEGESATDGPPEDNLVENLYRSGQKFQEEYAKEMASLFERYQGAVKTG